MIKVRPLDRRWDNDRKGLCEALDELLGRVRQVFGSYNNALWLMMGNAVDKLRMMPEYGQTTKLRVVQVYKQYKAYEARLRWDEASMMQLSKLSEESRKFYAEGTTDQEFFDYWCALGGEPYKMLEKWSYPLANKYKLFLQSRNASHPEESSWLMTVQNLFALQEDIWQRAVHDISTGLALDRRDIMRALLPYRMNDIMKAWWTLTRQTCPELKDIHPDETEEKNINASIEQILEVVDTTDFYFASLQSATESFEEIFRSNGYQKKALKQMAEARADWEARLK